MDIRTGTILKPKNAENKQAFNFENRHRIDVRTISGIAESFKPKILLEKRLF
jgi:hypothetical protein